MDIVSWIERLRVREITLLIAGVMVVAFIEHLFDLYVYEPCGIHFKSFVFKGRTTEIVLLGLSLISFFFLETIQWFSRHLFWHVVTSILVAVSLVTMVVQVWCL